VTKEIAQSVEELSIMRDFYGGALQAALPVVTSGLHCQCTFTHTGAVQSLRSAAPLTVRGRGSLKSLKLKVACHILSVIWHLRVFVCCRKFSGLTEDSEVYCE